MSEAPLVLFTTCVPAAAGLAACCAALGTSAMTAALALALASVGMAGSVFHLAKPLRAPTSLRGLRSSSLSQEIAAVAAFWVLLLAWLVAEGAVLAEETGLVVFDSGIAWALPLAARASCVLAALWGLALLYVINRAYRAPMRPAWDGPEGLGELVGIACGVGGSLYGLVGSIDAALAGSGFAPATWGAAGCGAPEGAVMITACALSCGLAVACALCPGQRVARLRRAVADGNKRAAGALAAAGRQRGPRRACALAVAGVALGLLATALHTLLAVPAPAAACWSAAAALQLAAAVELRVAFYRIPAPARDVWPLRK